MNPNLKLANLQPPYSLYSLRSFWLTPIFLFLVMAVCVNAASFTPETAATYALRNNPELIAARFLIHEAEGRLIQAGLWRNPEFEVDTDFAMRSWRGDRLVNLTLNQKFPLAGRLAKARTVARVDVAMSIEEFHNQERLIAGNVLGQARNILLFDKRITLANSQLALLDRILEQTSALASSGTGDTTGIGIAQLEKATLALQRESQIVSRAAALDQLCGLLGIVPGNPLVITGFLPSLPASFDITPDRADLRLALLNADKSNAEQHLARVEKWEDLNVGIGYTREKDGGQYENMAQLKFSLPLPLWDRNQGRLAETRAASERALADIEARRLAIETEIREARTRALGLASILSQINGSTMKLAKQNTARIELSVASGFASFLTIYESRRQHLNLATTALDTQTQLVAAITDWQTRTGQLPGIRLSRTDK